MSLPGEQKIIEVAPARPERIIHVEPVPTSPTPVEPVPAREREPEPEKVPA